MTYRRFWKRFFDVLLSALALVILSPLLLILTILVRVKLGSPVLFCQKRPGWNEKIFKLYKFRSMTNARDAEGRLLPDEKRLTPFGAALRNYSLDELPELWNILRGEMSIVGPRPQLVRDMVFMTPEQRKRHTVRPGLTGLAQVRGRNAITWEEKLEWDLKYIEKISFFQDVRIILETIRVALVRQEGITDGENATALDYGDALLKSGAVSLEEYDARQAEAQRILEAFDKAASNGKENGNG